MPDESLQEAIERVGSPVSVLRDAQAPPTIFPVTPEFSNWRSEQRAWRETCALLDQSHHMTDLFLQGPDALRLLSDLGVNSFASFEVDRAKQFVAVNEDGFLIGDAILFRLGRDSFDLVGWRMVIDWVRFHLETGDYDASAEMDENSLLRAGPPRLFRFELQGPTALRLVERLIGGPVPEIGFFGMGRFTIAGIEVRALRHGMAGQPGLELFGPWDEGERVREAILVAGHEFGLVRAGARAYSTANLESGWVPSPCPAIFTGDALEPYRRWLPVDRAGSLGGSLASDDIGDYYLTPYDLGYGRTIAFDHDFVGRDALARIADDPPRTKVTLVWDADDLTSAMATLFRDGPKAKYFELPKSRYALYQADAVLKGGRMVGISHDCGAIANERAFVSLATVEVAHAEPGTEVTVLWGEQPNSRKPAVEPHEQVEIRATVAPAPYVEHARRRYRTSTV
jgi:glycine cleavage system aminomethyltransferase T